MQPNWVPILQFAGSIFVLIIATALTEFLKRRPILIAHYGHVSAFKSNPADGKPINVHTHSVIIRNEGKKSAINVRVSHHYLPDFSVYPLVKYEIEPLPNEGKDILFPILRPKEEINISYLYSNTITALDIMSSVQSDEGSARVIDVWLAPVSSRSFNFVIYYFFLAGVLGTIYLISYFILKLI